MKDAALVGRDDVPEATQEAVARGAARLMEAAMTYARFTDRPMALMVLLTALINLAVRWEAIDEVVAAMRAAADDLPNHRARGPQ